MLAIDEDNSQHNAFVTYIPFHKRFRPFLRKNLGFFSPANMINGSGSYLNFGCEGVTCKIKTEWRVGKHCIIPLIEIRINIGG